MPLLHIDLVFYTRGKSPAGGYYKTQQYIAIRFTVLHSSVWYYHQLTLFLLKASRETVSNRIIPTTSQAAHAVNKNKTLRFYYPLMFY
ncbi:hypothetical protein AAW31_01765 [Nitrosomonas communis]|uniref:Uncharacterized protein n=1 Tax=Nitrosomonas communis TaxID=44574 RepID=A0A0F7KB71_9PROT|nr:hypothetical protein AAW31_01765 [Nitrosomonas communis]